MPVFWDYFQVCSNIKVRITCICINPEGSACMSEDELGIQLEEWESSDDKQEPPSLSAVEDSLLFESKMTSASLLFLCSCVANLQRMFLQAFEFRFAVLIQKSSVWWWPRLLMSSVISLVLRGHRRQQRVGRGRRAAAVLFFLGLGKDCQQVGRRGWLATERRLNGGFWRSTGRWREARRPPRHPGAEERPRHGCARRWGSLLWKLWRWWRSRMGKETCFLEVCKIWPGVKQFFLLLLLDHISGETGQEDKSRWDWERGHLWWWPKQGADTWSSLYLGDKWADHPITWPFRYRLQHHCDFFLFTFMCSVNPAWEQEHKELMDSSEVRWMFVFSCSFEQVAGGITQVLAGRDQRSASEREG